MQIIFRLTLPYLKSTYTLTLVGTRKKSKMMISEILLTYFPKTPTTNRQLPLNGKMEFIGTSASIAFCLPYLTYQEENSIWKK